MDGAGHMFPVFAVWLSCLLRLGKQGVFTSSLGPVVRAEMNGFVFIRTAEENVAVPAKIKLYFT